MISKTIGFRGTLFSDTPIYLAVLLIQAAKERCRFRVQRCCRACGPVGKTIVGFVTFLGGHIGHVEIISFIYILYIYI